MAYPHRRPVSQQWERIWADDDDTFVCLTGRGRGRPRSAYTLAMAAANRRANKADASALRKQSYSLFLKQRAVLFSAKKWK
ncbi:unnamed protein product [Colias eurytheme]|nr:unnamed protein product [Colias eurytheme]